MNGDLQGYTFGLDLLNSVISVKQFIDPIINIYGNDDKSDVRSLCRSLCDMFENLSDKDFSSRVDRIKMVLEHIPQIRAWFSRSTGNCFSCVYLIQRFLSGSNSSFCTMLAQNWLLYK